MIRDNRESAGLSPVFQERERFAKGGLRFKTTALHKKRGPSVICKNRRLTIQISRAKVKIKKKSQKNHRTGDFIFIGKGGHIMRQEYPRPQFTRKEWQSLNGEWEFEFDGQDRGLAERWYAEGKRLNRRIQVPFAYQSKLSGIGDAKSCEVVWYKRRFSVKAKEGKQVLLHFGAVDYEAKVFVNGHLAGNHEGGHTPFEIDITPFLIQGEQTIAVRAYDPREDEEIPRGKQFWEEKPRSIWYTGTTGIWQSVWLEAVDQKRVKQVKFTPLFDQGKIRIFCQGENVEREDSLEYSISLKGETVVRGRLDWITKELDFSVDLIQKHIFRTNFHDDGWAWTPESPTLFDVEFLLKDKEGRIRDQAESYFGFRKIHTENGMVYLNNKPYYQKLVLDQGYWREGILTAPDDEAFRQDILKAKEMGFNGCRKHQKTEDPRFLYWADKLGYLVWGECASAPMYSKKAAQRLMKEWTEIIERDYNHPSVVAWVPMNESWGVPNIHRDKEQQDFSQAMYYIIHTLDATRPVVSNDGWEMTKTDICAIHNYSHGTEEEKEKYREYREILSDRESLVSYSPSSWDIYAGGFSYQGEPILLTEFGGIGFDVSGNPGWGYTSVKNEEEFLRDYKRIMDAVYASKALWGCCYTQLSDVEQEINGLLTYDREFKVSPEKIREINEGYHLNKVRKKE